MASYMKHEIVCIDKLYFTNYPSSLRLAGIMVSAKQKRDLEIRQSTGIFFFIWLLIGNIIHAGVHILSFVISYCHAMILSTLICLVEKKACYV